MKILAINGSFRTNANTARIIEMLAAAMREVASEQRGELDFEIVHLGRQNIGFCRGCRLCFDRGEGHCPLQDDLSAIYAKMRAADGLILASPVYVNDVSGIMKNWIDRLAFLSHRPALAGKRALILTTVGLGPTRHAARTLAEALNTWGISLVGGQGFKMGAHMPKAQAESQFQDRTRQIAAKFYRALRRPPDPSFLSLMTFRIQQGYWWRQPEADSVDGQFWQSRGWTHPERNYYIHHQARKAKVALARLAGRMLAPFVT